jgi:ABC-type phosphate transport system substrate-binding protein
MTTTRIASWIRVVPFVLMFTLCAGGRLALAQISIVTAKSAKLDSNTVNKSAVKAIYMGAKLKWADGNKIHVVDQADTEVGRKFYATVIGKSMNEVRKQWTKLLLSGQASAPFKCPSDKVVKKVIATNPNAIGYIATSALDDTVKEILRIDGEAK